MKQHDNLKNMAFRLDRESSIPAYLQLSQWFECQIRAGKMKGGDMLPPIYSFRSGGDVSPMTIRQAYRKLEEQGLVQMKQGKGTCVTSLSEVPWNTVSRRVTNTNIGLLAFDVDLLENTAFVSSLISGISSGCRSHKIRSHVFSVAGSGLDEDENRFIRNLITSKSLSGLLIVGPLKRIDIEALDILQIPYVLIDNDIDDAPASPRVLIDDRYATAQMLKEVQRLGYRRIGLLCGPKGKKQNGVIRRAMKMAKSYAEFHADFLDGEADELCCFCEYDRDEAERVARKMIKKSNPNAIITNGDVLAIGAMNAVDGTAIKIFNYADSKQSPAAYFIKNWELVGLSAIGLLVDSIHNDGQVCGNVITVRPEYAGKDNHDN